MPEWSKGVDSSSTSLKTAWVRTPLQAPYLFCSRYTKYNIQCSKESNRKCIWPSKDQLLNDIKELNTNVAIGNKYNVTHHSVRRWIKKYNIK